MYMISTIDEMNLKQKDVIIIFGPAGSGKGTLISAINGEQMKYVTKDKYKDYPELFSWQNSVIIPVD